MRAFVIDALNCFAGARYYLREWVIMPNHVHAIVTPLAPYELSDIYHSWKSFTAKKINALLGTEGTVWQKESFDVIIRNADHLERIEKYIHDNPDGLPEGAYARGCIH